jgi:hypothetical protein
MRRTLKQDSGKRWLRQTLSHCQYQELGMEKQPAPHKYYYLRGRSNPIQSQVETSVRAFIATPPPTIRGSMDGGPQQRP